jgi:glyoxylase-like metal-dependent hydrolase (beta-lactamase superfamily II)
MGRVSPGVHVLSVPTPFAVGRVNTYLIEDDPLTLVDTGPNSGTSLAALVDALDRHGRRLAELERIVLTHQHIDHIGLARILVERSGAELWTLEALAPWLNDYSAEMEADDAFAEALMLRHGIPVDITIALRAVAAQFREWATGAEVTHTVGDGDVLGFAGRSWRVHHRPGHSPSDTVFFDETSGELICGDHLIKHISSNPLISRPLPGSDREPVQRPRALITYLDSLSATRELDVRIAYPGHGDQIEDHRTLIDERFAGHEQRAATIAEILSDGPKTGFEIAQRIWGNVAVTQAYLTLSEVLGHLDLLMDRGQVIELQTDRVVRYEMIKTPPALRRPAVARPSPAYE